MNIDQSQAPEGATHWYPGGEKFLSAWLKINGASVLYRRPWSKAWTIFDGGKEVFEGLVDLNGPWNGEGLPPVGTVCDWQASSQHAWERVTVVAYHGMNAWLHPIGIVGNPDGFRPIRTPEQVAHVGIYDRILSALRDDGQIRDPGRIARLIVEAVQAAP